MKYIYLILSVFLFSFCVLKIKPEKKIELNGKIFYRGAALRTAPAVLFIRDSRTFEALGTNFEEPNFTQGYFYCNKDTILFLEGLVDSVVLDVLEKTVQPKAVYYLNYIDVFLEQNDSILWKKQVLEMASLGDMLSNYTSNSSDITICLENEYKQEEVLMLFNRTGIIKELSVANGLNKPVCIYLKSGGHIISKKYYIKNKQSNLFIVSFQPNMDKTYPYSFGFMMNGRKYKNVGDTLLIGINEKDTFKLFKKTDKLALNNADYQEIKAAIWK